MPLPKARHGRPMNPRSTRLPIIVLAFDALVVAGVVLYFMLRR